MAQSMLLMHKDTPVIEINVDEAQYNVLTPQLLPYQLKGKIHRVADYSEIHSRYEDTQRQIAIQKNSWAVISYAGSRVLPITRDNAKKIYGLFGYEQRQDEYAKARIAFVCKAVSLQDDYWFKTANDSVKWKDVNIRHNSLSEIVAQVSLAGSSLTLQGEVCTPELNGQGAYAKAWKREEDGLYLHKTGAKVEGINRDYESQIEVTISNLLDKCNVEHVKYEMSELYGVSTCKCKCITDDHTSILPGMDFVSYCNVNGMDADKEIMKIDSDNIYKMWIVDYLTSNRDRHGMNWGFFYDTDTMQITKCHPLFDHNNAFDKALMQDKDAVYLYDRSMTMRQAAETAMKNVDFHFTQEITREDFMDDAQFESFTTRAKELGITIQKEKLLDNPELEPWLTKKLSEYTNAAVKMESFSLELAEAYKNTATEIKKMLDAPTGRPLIIKQMRSEHNSIAQDFLKSYDSFMTSSDQKSLAQDYIR